VTESASKRPKRLWLAALMNIVLGVFALFTLGYIALSSNVPAAVRPSAYTVVLAITTATLMVASSVLALFGKPRSPYFMLVGALLFYGILAAQNAVMLYEPHAWLGPEAGTKLAANVVRSGLEILINVWALLTAKTRTFFAVAAP
jgi:hypothetical protein